MKKQILLLSILLISLSMTVVFALPSEVTRSTSAEDLPPIVLKGELNDGGDVLRSTFTSIEAAQAADKEVLVYFNTNLGSVVVSVKNAQNKVVYQATVNTAVTQSISISTIGWPAGNYTLHIVRPSDGKGCSGEFVI